jgi:hypothetical protein
VDKFTTLVAQINMEQFLKILIYIHAALGGIALLSGLLALSVAKGQSVHKKAGKIFFYSMCLSAILSMVVSVMPNHSNLFLTGIAIITLYSLVKGYRALLLKRKPTDFTIDKLACGFLFLVGLGLLGFSALHEWNIVSLSFAGMSLFFSVRDFLSYGKPEELYKNWLKIHLGNMIGGYIAAVTAFVVVNNMFPSFWGWFAPTLVGVPYILYWNRRLK